jgi:cation/acetate symporter
MPDLPLVGRSFFIALLYTTAPAIAVFARTNFVKSVHNVHYDAAPSWFKNWEKTGLVGWKDKNGDGIMHHRQRARGKTQRASQRSQDRPDIMVLANPEIAKLPNWVVGLIGAGGLAAALSTAAGLLLVISAAISHDLMKGIVLKPNMGPKKKSSGGPVALPVWRSVSPVSSASILPALSPRSSPLPLVWQLPPSSPASSWGSLTKRPTRRVPSPA